MAKSSPVILIPAFNEQDTIWKTIHAIQRTGIDARIVVVNDGSTDNTVTVARRNHAIVLSLPKNIGKAGAVFAGLERLIRTTAPAIVLMDADMLTVSQQGLKHLIESAVNATNQKKSFMMVASVREGNSDYDMIKLSGIRSFSRAGVKKILAASDHKRVEGYALEEYLNRTFRKFPIMHTSGFVQALPYRKGEKKQRQQVASEVMRTVKGKPTQKRPKKEGLPRKFTRRNPPSK